MTKCESYDLTEWGKPFEKSVREIPDLPDKAVLVKVTAAGLCHSDLHIKKGFMDLGERGKLTFTQRGAQLPLNVSGMLNGLSSRPVIMAVNERCLAGQLPEIREFSSPLPEPIQPCALLN